MRWTWWSHPCRSETSAFMSVTTPTTQSYIDVNICVLRTHRLCQSWHTKPSYVLHVEIWSSTSVLCQSRHMKPWLCITFEKYITASIGARYITETHATRESYFQSALAPILMQLTTTWLSKPNWIECLNHFTLNIWPHITIQSRAHVAPFWTRVWPSLLHSPQPQLKLKANLRMCVGKTGTNGSQSTPASTSSNTRHPHDNTKSVDHPGGDDKNLSGSHPRIRNIS